MPGKTMMQFGSWKSRGKVVMVKEDFAMSESIEEEFTSFLRRQTSVEAWQINEGKQLPSWMKTASLNRCNRTPPLPPKSRLPEPPTPPPRGRKSRGFLGSSDLPPSTSCSVSDLSSSAAQPPLSLPRPSPFFPRVK